MSVYKVIQTKFQKLSSTFRIFIIQLSGARLGNRITIYRGWVIYNAQNLTIGDEVFINDFFWCNAKGGVKIGSNVIMGPNVTIHSSNHNYNIDNLPFMYQGHKDHEVIIGNNVWLGASVIILPGVQICDNVVVGAGAIVTKSIFNSGVYAGNPAKFIKSI